MEHKHEIFIPHTKYYYSFVCDASSYVEIEVIKRTAKTVTIKDQFGEVSKRKIYHMNNVEYIKPCGTYSMNPICTAEKIVTEEIDHIDEASEQLDEIENDTLNTEEVVQQLEMCLEKRDYRQDIEQIDDGIIGIPITRANMNDTAAIWEALKSAPTPKKGEQWKLHND
tara:strand:- start:641 stop:1144 length:504 start_codon:yes stop_codon:yes gene_type:complete